MSKPGTKEWWDERYAASRDYLFSKEPSPFLARWSKILPEKSKVIELACGEGRNAVALASIGHEVIASDFSEAALEKARHLARESSVEVNFKKQDLDFFMPDLMSYDAIVAIDFKPPQTVLKNMIRGLRQGGFVMIESFLVAACKERKDLEVFETFKPGELLREMGGGMNYQVRYYSEYGPEFENNKVYLIVQKTEML